MELLITQGLVLSTGGSIMYWAASTYLWSVALRLRQGFVRPLTFDFDCREWFVEKRGLAVGILFSGTGEIFISSSRDVRHI